MSNSAPAEHIPDLKEINQLPNRRPPQVLLLSHQCGEALPRCLGRYGHQRIAYSYDETHLGAKSGNVVLAKYLI